MAMQRKDVFVCDYDGVDTATVYNTIELPAGWVVTKDRFSEERRYWHNNEHAFNGAGGGVLGGVYSGGRTTTYIWTDDYDGTVATTTTVAMPNGWVEARRANGAFIHFKDDGNLSLYLQANP